MPKCDYCGEEFDSKEDLHLHWDEHRDELNSHEKEKVKKAERNQKEKEKQKMRKKKQYAGYALAGILAIGLVGVVGAQLMDSGGKSSAQFGDLSNQPMMGQKDAPVTVVEFGDYRCPFCAEFENQIFPKLEKNFIDTGKAKFYFINFAFLDQSFPGSSSTRAAVASECVYRQNPDQFWKFHESIYKNQGPENKDWATVETLMTIARQSTSDLDYEKLRTCIKNRKTLDQVQNDRRIGRQAGVRGTPSVYVNGDKVDNWNNYNALAQKINKALEE